MEITGSGRKGAANVLLGPWPHHKTRSYPSHPRGRPLLEEYDQYGESKITMSQAEETSLGMLLSRYS